MRFASITVALFAAAAAASVIVRDDANPDVALVTDELEQPFNATDMATADDDYNEFVGEELSDDLSEEDLESLLNARDDKSIEMSKGGGKGRGGGGRGGGGRGSGDGGRNKVKPNIPKVVFGMQKQNSDGKVHWTAWKYGANPCTKNVVLNVKTESACQKKFTLAKKGGLKLASCLGKDNLPHALKHNDKEIRGCHHKRVKHNCPFTRDVVERGSC
ncbi:hypothetical protein PG995_011691 [Apiospora arundinis]